MPSHNGMKMFLVYNLATLLMEGVIDLITVNQAAYLAAILFPPERPLLTRKCIARFWKSRTDVASLAFKRRELRTFRESTSVFDPGRMQMRLLFSSTLNGLEWPAYFNLNEDCALEGYCDDKARVAWNREDGCYRALRNVTSAEQVLTCKTRGCDTLDSTQSLAQGRRIQLCRTQFFLQSLHSDTKPVNYRLPRSECEQDWDRDWLLLKRNEAIIDILGERSVWTDSHKDARSTARTNFDFHLERAIANESLNCFHYELWTFDATGPEWIPLPACVDTPHFTKQWEEASRRARRGMSSINSHISDLNWLP